LPGRRASVRNDPTRARATRPRCAPDGPSGRLVGLDVTPLNDVRLHTLPAAGEGPDVGVVRPITGIPDQHRELRVIRARLRLVLVRVEVAGAVSAEDVPDQNGPLGAKVRPMIAPPRLSRQVRSASRSRRGRCAGSPDARRSALLLSTRSGHASAVPHAPGLDGVGWPGALQPPAPTDPGVTVSRHRALLISRSACGSCASG
jgi:hypothetical protein